MLSLYFAVRQILINMSAILSLDFLIDIVKECPSLWTKLLTIPIFNEWALTPEGKKQNRLLFQTVDMSKDGTKKWYKNDILHREDGPAVEHHDGTKEWYHNGELHRIDGPAVEYANGNKEWHFNGELHSENGPSIEYINGAE